MKVGFAEVLMLGEEWQYCFIGIGNSGVTSNSSIQERLDQCGYMTPHVIGAKENETTTTTMGDVLGLGLARS